MKFVKYLLVIIITALAAQPVLNNLSKKAIPKNEKAAAETLKVLGQALEEYRKDCFSYPATLSALSSGMLSTKYLERVDILADEKPLVYPRISMYGYSGYWYIYFPKGTDRIMQYLLIAVPRKPNLTGVRRFRMTQNGKVFIEQPKEGKPPTLTPYSE